MSDTTLVSPNDMFAAAKDNMLEGADPVSDRDWQMVINFVAFNTGAGAELPVTKIFAKLFDCPLEEETVIAIAAAQVRAKAAADDAI